MVLDRVAPRISKTTEIGIKCFSFRGINYVWMGSHVLAMSNSCVNPFIYGIYNVIITFPKASVVA